MYRLTTDIWYLFSDCFIIPLFHFSYLLNIYFRFLLYLTFWQLHCNVPWVDLCGFILLGNFLGFWMWLSVSFHTLWKFSAIVYLNKYSVPFCFLFSFWDPCNAYIGPLDGPTKLRKNLHPSSHFLLGVKEFHWPILEFADACFCWI